MRKMMSVKNIPRSTSEKNATLFFLNAGHALARVPYGEKDCAPGFEYFDGTVSSTGLELIFLFFKPFIRCRLT